MALLATSSREATAVGFYVLMYACMRPFGRLPSVCTLSHAP